MLTRLGVAARPGGSYKDMWWLTNNAHGAYMARGIDRQSISIAIR